MKSNKNFYKEILFICFFSLIISLVYNYSSSSGIPFIRPQILLIWESDSSLFKQQNNIMTDTTLKTGQNIINEQKKNPILKDDFFKPEQRDKHFVKNTVLPDTSVKDKNSLITDTIKPENIVIEKNAPTAILIEQAYKIFNSNIAVFIDARIEFEYNLQHVKGAISIPLQKFDDYKSRLNNISKNQMLVVYCDGRGCEESIDLAAKINSMGYTNVKVFYGGWFEWKEKNYPMEK